MARNAQGCSCESGSPRCLSIRSLSSAISFLRDSISALFPYTMVGYEGKKCRTPVSFSTAFHEGFRYNNWNDMETFCAYFTHRLASSKFCSPSQKFLFTTSCSKKVFQGFILFRIGGGRGGEGGGGGRCERWENRSMLAFTGYCCDDDELLVLVHL